MGFGGEEAAGGLTPGGVGGGGGGTQYVKLLGSTALLPISLSTCLPWRTHIKRTNTFTRTASVSAVYVNHSLATTSLQILGQGFNIKVIQCALQ
jgi:hypothetical protein